MLDESLSYLLNSTVEIAVLNVMTHDTHTHTHFRGGGTSMVWCKAVDQNAIMDSKMAMMHDDDDDIDDDDNDDDDNDERPASLRRARRHITLHLRYVTFSQHHTGMGDGDVEVREIN